MENIWVRPIRYSDPSERRLFIEWMYAARDKNRYDPNLFELGPDGRFTRCEVWTCFNSREIVGFVPVARAFVLESLAFKPELDPSVEARALQAVQHVLVFKANFEGVNTARFVTFDDDVLRFAKRYGWSEPAVPTLTLDFSSLEPIHEDKIPG